MNLKWTKRILLTEANVDTINEVSGVYRLIYDDATKNERGVYYVGQATDLNKRLSEHLPGNEKKKCCKEFIDNDKYKCYLSGKRSSPMK